MAPTATTTPASTAAPPSAFVKDLPVPTVHPDIAGLSTTAVGPGPTAARGALGPDTAALLSGTFDDVVANVRRAYIGKDSTVRLSLCCLMAEGHLLVEDHPGRGQDHAGQGPGPIARARLRPGPVHRRPPARRRHRRHGLRPRQRTPRRSGPARCSPTSCWPTSSTGPPPRPSRRCSRPWRSTRSAWTASRHPLPTPFMVHRHPEPLRRRRHVPPAPQPARPLPPAPRPRLPRPRRPRTTCSASTAPTRPRPIPCPAWGSLDSWPPSPPPSTAAYVAPEVRGYVLDIVRRDPEPPRSHRRRLAPRRSVGGQGRSAVAVSSRAALT